MSDTEPYSFQSTSAARAEAASKASAPTINDLRMVIRQMLPANWRHKKGVAASGLAPSGQSTAGSRTRKGLCHCLINQHRCPLMQFLRMRPSVIGEYSNELG